MNATPKIGYNQVLKEARQGFRGNSYPLMARASLLMAVPAVVLLIRTATDNYWAYLTIWTLGLVIMGYTSWPLARTALAAVTPGMVAPSEDWWVRDGFVRASMGFFLTLLIGLLILVIPALMVAMIYSLYPFCIIEKRAKGMQSLAMSSEWSRGNRLRILRILVFCSALFVPALIALNLSNQTDPFMGMELRDMEMLGILGFWVFGIPALAFTSVFVAAAYREIAKIKG